MMSLFEFGCLLCRIMERLALKRFTTIVSRLLLVYDGRSGPDLELLLLDPNILVEIKSNPANKDNTLSNVGR